MVNLRSWYSMCSRSKAPWTDIHSIFLNSLPVPTLTIHSHPLPIPFHFPLFLPFLSPAFLPFLPHSATGAYSLHMWQTRVYSWACTIACCCFSFLWFPHQARSILFYCTDIVCHYQLILKSVLFCTLMEYGALVNEMLLMMSGDIESNPGPSE